MPTDDSIDDSTGDSADTQNSIDTDDSTPADDSTPSATTVVETAAEAAESVVFSRLDGDELEDYDVSVTFEDGVLEVDVYVLAPDSSADEGRVADDAALAARSAVDELF